MINSCFFMFVLYFHSRYEVNFQDGIDCGGAYIKLLSDTDDLTLVGIHVALLLSIIMCKMESYLCIAYIRASAYSALSELVSM